MSRPTHPERPEPMIQVGVKMSESLQSQIIALAREDRRSFSEFCRISLEDVVKERALAE